MTLPAESQVGRGADRGPPAPSGTGRWMAVHDRIRLIDRLRRGPRQGPSLVLDQAGGASRGYPAATSAAGGAPVEVGTRG